MEWGLKGLTLALVGGVLVLALSLLWVTIRRRRRDNRRLDSVVRFVSSPVELRMATTVRQLQQVQRLIGDLVTGPDRDDPLVQIQIASLRGHRRDLLEMLCRLTDLDPELNQATSGSDPTETTSSGGSDDNSGSAATP